MIKELESVVLTTNLPEHSLTSGDIGTVVLVHEGGRGSPINSGRLAGTKSPMPAPWRWRKSRLSGSIRSCVETNVPRNRLKPRGEWAKLPP